MTKSFPSPVDALAGAQQKVTREVDAGHPQTRPAGHLEVNDGERNGNSGAPFHHLVEETVARIVVVLPVADESLLVVEVLVERTNRVESAGSRARDSHRRVLAHARQTVDVGRRVERGILDARNRQGGGRDVFRAGVHRPLELRDDLRGPRLQMQRIGHWSNSTTYG